MGPDAGAGWQGDVAPSDEPPPTPFERAADPGPAPEPRRRRLGRVLLVAAAVALVATGALLLDARTGPVADGGSTGAADATADATADAALLELLVAVDAAELVMLDFDAAARAAFEDATSEEEVLDLVTAAADAAVTELRSARDGFDDPLPDAAADDVRAAYLPHLDAWIAYLAAVAADPGVLLGAGEEEALILRINATAGVFVAALEDAVAAGVGGEVEAAARAIIERGFPDEEDADL